MILFKVDSADFVKTFSLIAKHVDTASPSVGFSHVSILVQEGKAYLQGFYAASSPGALTLPLSSATDVSDTFTLVKVDSKYAQGLKGFTGTVAFDYDQKNLTVFPERDSSESFAVSIEYSGAEFMKAMPEVEDLQEISTDFTRLFKHVEKAVSTDSTRTHLTNIYFEKQEDALCAVATDGHRLHLAISQDSSAATKVLDGFLVSCYRLLQDWFKFYGVSTVLVGKQKLTGTLLLKIGSSWLTMSSSSQSFPDYKAVVPSEKSIKSRWVSQNKKAWIQKLEQVKAQGFDSVILSQDGDFAVLKGNNLVKKATLDAASQKKVAIDFEEKPLPYQVSLNISYLCDAVNSISTDVFTLHFGGDNMSPLVLESQDESTISFLITQDNSRLSCKSVIMPQRI